MDLSFDAEQEEFARTCRNLLEDQCPISLVREVAGPKGEGHSERLWQALAAAGWLGLVFPADLGGSGASLVELGIAYREAGRALVPTTLSSTMFAALLIQRLGTVEQSGPWISRVATGDAVATVAFAELGAERSASHLATTARPTAAGWRLDGHKMYVPNAARADVIVVAARVTSRGPTSSLGFFVVPRNTPGVEILAHQTFSHDAQHQVRLDGAVVGPAAHLGAGDAVGTGIGPSSEAGYEEVLDAVTALACMEMLGGAEKVLDLTCDYVKGREQFGRAIGTFQAVQHHIANMAAGINGGRLAALQALWLVSAERPAAREVSIAKAWLSRVYADTTVLAHQLHGGMGYVRETDLHLWSQRAKTLEAQNGNADVHLRRVATALLG